MHDGLYFSISASRGLAWLFSLLPVGLIYRFNISASALDEDHFHLAGEVFEGETTVTLADWLVLRTLASL